MAAAAKTADPGIELDRIDYYLSRYSKAPLDRAADRLVAQVSNHGTLGGFQIYAATSAAGHR